MRLKQSAMVSLLALACAGPTQPASPTGTWTLVAVDGTALPAAVHPDVFAVSGTLSLNADGTYAERTTFTQEGRNQEVAVEGSWRLNGAVVELLNRIVGLPYAGRWNGSGLEIRGQFMMQYAR